MLGSRKHCKQWPELKLIRADMMEASSAAVKLWE
jgi:hypothetical protein